jgi:glutathione S-transferase
MKYPILYSFRRCPYAIRARMTLCYANINVYIREIVLKNKPESLTQLSPKATVPVLALEDGQVIDESLDIINWALSQSDPDGWRCVDKKRQSDDLIMINDHEFKPLLDGYKYPQSSKEQDPHLYRDKAYLYLAKLNAMLETSPYLLTRTVGISDVCLFPFIRQFYYVDSTWFESLDLIHLKKWLHSWLASALFNRVMVKCPLWQEGQKNGVTLF